MTVKYTSKRPDEAYDSLQAFEDDWTHPTQEPDSLIVVARVTRTGIAKPTASGDWQATAGFSHVEVLAGPQAETAEKLLRDAYQSRSGNAELDIPTPAVQTVNVADPFDASPPVPIKRGKKTTTDDGPEAA